MIYQAIEDNISIITIETGRGNSFSTNDLRDFLVKISEFASFSDLKGLILTGSNKSFSIGGDINSIVELNELGQLNYFKLMDEVLIKLFSIDKPVVSAVNGHSIGFGFLMMLCSDYIISTENQKTKFGLPELKIGMAIDSIMCEILNFNNITGKNLGRIIYSYDLFGVDKSLESKMIDLVVSEQDLIQKSKEIINSLILDNSSAFKINKNVIREKSIQKMKKDFENQCYNNFVDLLKNRSLYD